MSHARSQYQANLQEWYSEPLLSETSTEVMSVIDVDPFSSAEANEVVKAIRFIDREMDGFVQPWGPHVFTAPMSSLFEKGRFNLKFRKERDEGRMVEAIILVPSNVNTSWYHELRKDVQSVFVPGRRIRFRRGSAIEGCQGFTRRDKKPCQLKARHADACKGYQTLGNHEIFYMGGDPIRFEAVFSGAYPGFVQHTKGDDR